MPFSKPPKSKAREQPPGRGGSGAGGPTNEVVEVVEGMFHKRLGGGDIVVSEMGLGTQRWGGADFNSPDEALCHKLMDRAVLERGVNLVRGRWCKLDPSSKEKRALVFYKNVHHNLMNNEIRKKLAFQI